MIYLIGSLRNPRIPEIAKALRIVGHDIWDDWFAAGEFADDAWRDYEKGKGHDFAQALAGEAAQHVLEFDKSHLDLCDSAILVMPAGKSGHLELGYVLGQGKPGYILLDGEPERYDVMAGLATGVATSLDGLIEMLAPEPSADKGVLSLDDLSQVTKDVWEPYIKEMLGDYDRAIFRKASQ